MFLTRKKKYEDEERIDRLIKGSMRAHIQNGPGARKARLYVAQKMHQKMSLYQYNRFKDIAMRRTFRNLEDFVHRFCNKKIQPLKPIQENKIKTPMLQCREWMSQEHADTFLRFVRVQCLGEKVGINPNLALGVYDMLVKLAKDASYKKQFKGELQEEKKRLLFESIASFKSQKGGNETKKQFCLQKTEIDIIPDSDEENE